MKLKVDYDRLFTLIGENMSKFVHHPEVTMGRAGCMEDMVLIKKKPVFKCPICNQELLFDGYKKLETLDEHVSDPNGEIPEKFSFSCRSSYCPANKKNLYLVWNSNGEVYVLGNYYSLDFLKSDNSECAAIGSWSGDWAREKDYKKRMTRQFSLGNIRVKIRFIHNPFKWEFSFIYKGIYKVYERSIHKWLHGYWLKYKRHMEHKKGAV